MTERLYYTDAYATRFSARVVERLEWGGRPAVVLDRSAFYPASGGQPADGGTLGGVRVADVVVREADGAVVHVVEQALEPDTLDGQVDWPRRFDHMQQHSGQHILSAAFEQLFDADTVGFHLGAETSTVDIAISRLEMQAAERVESLSNRVIWEDRAVTVRVVTLEELAGLELRRAPAVTGPVRIVEVAGFDRNPCGGTHVARTGEIGLLKLVRLDYRGSDTRVEFVCGERALCDYRAKHELANRLAAKLTTGYRDVEQGVERLQAEARQLHRELQTAQKRLLELESQELAQAAEAVGANRVVWRVWQQRRPEELCALALALAERPAMVALLAGISERAHLCFASAEGTGLDMAVLLREVCHKLGGKGGGQARLAQGSAPELDPARVNAVLADVVSNLAAGG